MIDRYLFKCTRCKTELLGPVVKPPANQTRPGALFNYGSPVACRESSCPIVKPKLAYVGIGKRPPPAPAPPGQAPKSNIPMKWEPAVRAQWAVIEPQE